MAGIGQRCLSHYSSFVEQNQALSPGRLWEVNRWVGMSSWFCHPQCLCFIFFPGHTSIRFHQNSWLDQGGLGLKWRWNVAPGDFQLSKTWSRKSWAICWALSEPQGLEVLGRCGVFFILCSHQLSLIRTISQILGVYWVPALQHWNQGAEYEHFPIWAHPEGLVEPQSLDQPLCRVTCQLCPPLCHPGDSC